jgi:hypothetical protein
MTKMTMSAASISIVLGDIKQTDDTCLCRERHRMNVSGGCAETRQIVMAHRDQHYKQLSGEAAPGCWLVVTDETTKWRLCRERTSLCDYRLKNDEE